MKTFYMNKNPHSVGFLEIHKEGCRYLPKKEDLKYLGSFHTIYEAMKENPISLGCEHCLLSSNIYKKKQVV